MSAVSPAPSTVLEHRSPGITAMYNEVKKTGALRILDLGCSSAASFNFFRQLSCQIHFENLSEFVSELINNPSSEEIIEALDGYLSTFKPQQTFDVILVWDLFNYLDLDIIRWLMTRLSPHCKPGTLVHCIKYVSPQIPVAPRYFQINNQYDTTVEGAATKHERRFPCPNTTTFLRNLPDFSIEQSYMNYNGMVPGFSEQLLRFQPGRKLISKRQASNELSHKQTVSQPTQTVKHHSSALNKVFNNESPSSRQNILDLGIKNRHNYDFFYTVFEEVFAENIYYELLDPSSAKVATRLKSHMLDFPPQTQFDVILAWDIFAFLPAHMITEVITRLAPYTHPDTKLHTLLYFGKETPAAPQRYSVLSASDLEIHLCPRQRTSPPMTSSELLKAIPKFQLEETFVYRPGMQRGIYEYILKRGNHH